MTALNTLPNVARPDGLYAQLIDLHQGLTREQSLKVWSRLVLILANHIGDEAVLTTAIGLARPQAPEAIAAAPLGCDATQIVAEKVYP